MNARMEGKRHLTLRTRKKVCKQPMLRHVFHNSYAVLVPAIVLVSFVPLLLFPVVEQSSESIATVEAPVHVTNESVPHEGLDLANMVTIGIKTYVCEDRGAELLTSALKRIRENHLRVKILIANDGPFRMQDSAFLKNDADIEELILPHRSGKAYGRNVIVRRTQTDYVVFMDDDHLFSNKTDIARALRGLQEGGFDLVGLRVVNLRGSDKAKKTRMRMPRGVTTVSKFEHREVTMCMWIEEYGPPVGDMRMPMQVDTFHSAFVARTMVLRRSPWRNVLKLKEMVTFFLDAKEAGLKIGYLPSVEVYHAEREYVWCYKQGIGEFEFDKYLPYNGSFQWDFECGEEFPKRVEEFLALEVHQRLK